MCVCSGADLLLISGRLFGGGAGMDACQVSEVQGPGTTDIRGYKPPVVRPWLRLVIPSVTMIVDV